MGVWFLYAEEFNGVSAYGSVCVERVSMFAVVESFCVIDKTFSARGTYFLDANSQPLYAQGVFKEFSEE